MFNEKFWKNRRVFITGHSGFKGTWLCHWLNFLDAEVWGYSKDVSDEQYLFSKSALPGLQHSFYGDIRDEVYLQKCLSRVEPEIIFHLAAQPIVRRSFLEPVETFSTNVMGTLKLLNCSRQLSHCKAIVVITSDKCYENHTGASAFRESDRLGGDDPYSASKACTEIAVQSFAKSFFDSQHVENSKPALATARAGNIIGGGDWGEDRLIPDLARSIKTGGKAIIRSPDSIRPWQFILDALTGYFVLAENLYHDGNKFAGSWNFGPSQSEVLPVKVLANKFIEQTDIKIEVRPKLKDNIEEKLILRIDAEKARQLLKWQTRMSLERSISLTRQWYIDFYKGYEATEICKKQIEEYLQC